MSKSRLQLEQCFPVVLEIIAKNNTCEVPSGSAEPLQQFKYELRKHPEKWSYFLQMHLQFEWTPESDSYYERITTIWNGFFCMPDDTTEAEVNAYLPVMGIANMLGIARGQIAQITGTFLGGAFYFPLLDMNDLLAEGISKEAIDTMEVASAGEETHPIDLAPGE